MIKSVEPTESTEPTTDLDRANATFQRGASSLVNAHQLLTGLVGDVAAQIAREKLMNVIRELYEVQSWLARAIDVRDGKLDEGFGLIPKMLDCDLPASRPDYKRETMEQSLTRLQSDVTAIRTLLSVDDWAGAFDAALDTGRDACRVEMKIGDEIAKRKELEERLAKVTT